MSSLRQNRSPSSSNLKSNGKQPTVAPQNPVRRTPSPARPTERLTLKSGCPLGDKFNSLTVGPYGPNLLADTAYIEESAHFNRERIPERVVHAKGAAASGDFVVSDASEITKYCKANVFSGKGKTTQVVARFSHVTGESGVADTTRDVRGFAVKFFTEAGNWDLVGNNLPVFFLSDPINFASFIHTQKRNPKTHLRDPEAFWYYVAENPESLHTLLMLFSERGIPDGFRHMHGYGVNTFKLINERNQAFYAKFHWICNQKIRNLDPSMADVCAGIDPDYSLRDLATNIESKNYPSWTLKFQVMDIEEANKLDFNPFDVTKTWPQAKFPLKEIGKMTLWNNADNYFSQVEQLAFSPANMVPGIEASLDKMLIGRMFSYPDAQRYRLGTNYADIPVNRPKCPVMTPTYCDGQFNISNLSGSVPNYVPNNKMKALSKQQDARLVEHPQEFNQVKIGRYDWSKEDNYSQPKVFVSKVLSSESKGKLATAIGSFLASVKTQDTVSKVMKHFALIDSDLAKSIEEAVAKAKQAPRLLP